MLTWIRLPRNEADGPVGQRDGRSGSAGLKRRLRSGTKVRLSDMEYL